MQIIAQREQWAFHSASASVSLYHLTDKPDFALDPDFTPENAVFGRPGEASDPGVYLTQTPEMWGSAGYNRPYVAEIQAPPEIEERYRPRPTGGPVEYRVPASEYPHLRVRRVMPLDAYHKEMTGYRGPVENFTKNDFETGQPWSGDVGSYKFQGDTRTWTPEQRAAWEGQFQAYSAAQDKPDDEWMAW